MSDSFADVQHSLFERVQKISWRPAWPRP